MKPTNQTSHISQTRCESCELDCVISIVVPVYNAGNTIERCINSVISQKYLNWELILVDDGSSDSSGVICDEYARKDSRVKVFHKPNEGVSSARNLALDKAAGKWVTFVDSDDMIRPKFLEYFVEGTKKDDFQLAFLTDYISDYQGRIIVNHVADAAFWDEQDITAFLRQYVDAPILKAVHSKFFVTEIIQKNSVCFNHAVRAGEDHLFVLEYLKYIHAAKVIEGIGYIYYLPYNYSLKYGQSITEITYKLGLMEEQMELIEKKFKIDLALSKKRKWHHGLSGVNVVELYDNRIFTEFLHWYNVKIGEDYASDVKCNREARVANILLQIVGRAAYRKKYEMLLSLLCLHIKQADYALCAFSRSTKVILFVASLRLKWLLKFFLSLVYGYR
ncbi:glycosyltransferase family 2 protein [Bacteroides sp.]|uniref:glycosyltransferase family 2 protein n=1 Tax=Bacteroides sp. TaxID=29523 RepID=UPI0025C702FF|nr:glycosyltransferase family 2 protein [Bacteroides sp.]